ncbi:MAG TPA: hypothetical protein VGP55_08430 [Chitinophagaceae bacterium]|nr:hypothetical protein [Chitinophagaceae bacterium]
MIINTWQRPLRETFLRKKTDDCKDYGMINIADGFSMPAKSIVTLYKKELMVLVLPI